MSIKTCKDRADRNLVTTVLSATLHSSISPPSFLGYVDLLGTTYSAPTLATGFGSHIAQPLLREAYEAKAGVDGTGELLTCEEAEKLLDECMKVLFYRDARSLNKVCVSLRKIRLGLIVADPVSNRDHH